MKVLVNWLKEFVELAATPEHLRSRLSLSGTSIDSIEQTPAGPMLDAEVSANRPDCLGHYGIAREAAALYRRHLKAVQPKLTEATDPASQATRVDIESPDLCARYTARVIRGVKIQPSPDWLKQRLEALGHASINNVVDVTNFKHVVFNVDPEPAKLFARQGDGRFGGVEGEHGQSLRQPLHSFRLRLQAHKRY